MSRIGKIATRIRETSGVDFWVTEVDDINGDRVQAIADGHNNSIQITRTLAEKLDDDELAYVLGHEVAHLERRHTEKQELASSAAASIVRAGVRAAGRALSNSRVGLP